MKLQDITVILTCCNSLISPSQIECLKEVKERNIKIIGVDMTSYGVGSRLVDKYYKIVPANDPNYANELMTIAKKENTDVIIPASDDEVFILSKIKDQFHKEGIQIAINDSEVIETAGDKGSFLNFLKTNNLPCADFRVPTNIDEFQNGCKELGFPNKPVVIKPRRGRGSRGFRIITPHVEKADLILNQKPGSPQISLEEMKEALEKAEKFPDIVLMEFLPGMEYSCDVLCKNGSVIYSVPKIREKIDTFGSVGAKVDLDETVLKMIEDIVSAFKFNYNVNIQFRFGEDGKLYPYEVNTRIAATIAACRLAGANLLYFGVKLALNETIPKNKIKNGLRMMRYYQGYYETD